MRTATWRSSGLSARTLVEITNLYLLVVAALGAGERTHLAGAEGGDDRRLVEVEDVAALLALLLEGDDRAPLVHDLAPRHLYSHLCSLPRAYQTNPRHRLYSKRYPRLSPEIVLIEQRIAWYVILNDERCYTVADLPEIRVAPGQIPPA